MAPVPKVERKCLELQCEWGSCRKTFSTSQAITAHLMIHAEDFMSEALSIEKCLADDQENSDEYQCQWADCGHVTEEGSAALLRHLLFHGYHTRIKWQGTAERERCKVEPCQLEAHSRNIIPEVPSSFKCGWDDCSFITNNPDFFYCHVEMHSQMTEARRGTLACSWIDCHVKTKDKYKLRDHLRCHSQEKKFGCSQCGGLFSNRTKFFDHIHRQSILDEPNYQCSHCSKVFASERLLRDHMRHHVNHYKCPFCDMTCPAPSVLKKHIQWRHSSDRPFSCELCQHRAKTRTDMRRHLESHNAEDAYQCDIEGCTYAAKSLSTLRVHFRTRHSELESKRYMCHVCSKKFTRGSRLTKHLKDKHRFKWPSGHVRFRYKEHDDGFLRLQTVRYESIELTQQILQDNPSSPPRPALQEEDVGGVQNQPKAAEGADKNRPETTKPQKSSYKEPSSRTCPSKAVGVPYELQPGEIQYLRDEHGRIVIINCPGSVKQKAAAAGANESSKLQPADGVYEVVYLNSDNGSESSNANYEMVDDSRSHAGIADHEVIDDRCHTQNESHGIHHPAPQRTRTATSTVVLVSGGLPLSQKCLRQEDDLPIPSKDNQSISNESNHYTPNVLTFPVEQLQTIDELSDQESIGERAPKKARYEFTKVVQERVANSSISDDERMRNLFPSLEDDRMAMAVEAMTNLSRGIIGK